MATVMIEGLITHRPPPLKRAGKCDGGSEYLLSEGAVMLAFALHLLRTVPGLTTVSIHPDGEHGKRFAILDWLARQGFEKHESKGKTSYGGVYIAEDGRSIVVDPSSAHGADLIAHIGTGSIVAECKGGILNTKHSGQMSRLRRGLCEAVGLSMARPITAGRSQYVVVPHTDDTEKLARKMLPRVKAAGIRIALVDGHGNVLDIE